MNWILTMTHRCHYSNFTDEGIQAQKPVYVEVARTEVVRGEVQIQAACFCSCPHRPFFFELGFHWLQTWESPASISYVQGYSQWHHVSFLRKFLLHFPACACGMWTRGAFRNKTWISNWFNLLKKFLSSSFPSAFTVDSREIGWTFNGGNPLNIYICISSYSFGFY